MITDTERLDFMIADGGELSPNQGYGYIYWYRGYTARTEIVKDRTARDALDAAIQGEKGV